MRRKVLLRRMTAAACAIVLTVSLLFTCVSASADSYISLDNMLKLHDAAFGQREECTAIIEKAVAKNDIRELIIHYFFHNVEYYRENGLKPDFPFFNADKYLLENPDVAAEVGNSRSGALEHYLKIGALEGRSSCTEFDPIIAITLLPEASILTPEALKNIWIEVMGTDSTDDYILCVTSFGQYKAIKKNSGSEAGGTTTDGSREPEDKKSYTLMVYLCGSDLESREFSNNATKALVKIIMGAYDEENVNVVVLAGGADKWKNTYFDTLLSVEPGEKNKSAIFSVNKEGVKAYVEEWISQLDDVNNVDELYAKVRSLEGKEAYRSMADTFINEHTLNLIGDVSTAAMGDPNTLLSLLNTASSGDFKADQYGLSLWNHGGGSVEGVCFPDDNKSDPLEIPEIKTAIQYAGFGSTASDAANKLGLLAFDACLMAGAEIAAYLNDCYDMMYASEEATYGDIDYYNAINIANEKAGDKYLSYWLAVEIVEDRLLNYTGNQNMLATGALFENGKAGDSMTKLNAVAAELNKLTADDETAQEVYRAFKNARLKCEQIGASTTAYASKDYVDLRNFLDMLESELNASGILDTNTALASAITDAKAAADEATYATVFNYCGQKIFYNLQDSDDVWFNRELWDQLKGMVLTGASIFVPYYGAESGKGLTDFEKNYADALPLSDYVEFIKKFSSDYLNSDAEKERIKHLTEALTSSFEGGSTVAGYAQMLDMSMKQTDAGQVLSIEVKNYTPEEATSQYTSGDAFVDLCETMDTLLVYITRRAQAIYSENGITVNDRVANIDVVVGSRTVSYENLNGLQSAVNIFTDQFDEVNMKVISSTDPENSQDYDFVVPSDIEGYTQKTDMIKAIMPEGSELTKSAYLTVKGTAKLSDSSVVTAYHLFHYDPSFEKFVYVGSSQLDEQHDWKVGPKLEDTQSITFYHQMINGSTNKLVYVEEYAWKTDDGKTDSFVSLNNPKEYLTSDGNNIMINSIALENIGVRSDNGYYIAVSQNENKIDDDVFSGSCIVNEDGTDIMTSIDAAMNPTAAEETPAAAEEAPASTEEAPAAVEETPAAVEETPAAVEEAPAAVEEAPAAAEETPAAVEEAPGLSDTPPVEHELAA